MPVDIQDYDIRYSQAEDLSKLKLWLAKPEVARWLPMTTEEQRIAAAECWSGFYRFKSSITATSQGIPIGMATLFLMPYKKVSHHCLLKIVVDPPFQNKGVGRDLIKNSKHLAKDYLHLENIHAEVFEGNPLIPLLKREGFQDVLCQPHFIKSDEGYLCRYLLDCSLRGDT